MRLPDFIVIGAMKCATSTVHEQLAMQTGIFMSTPKEPNFFSDDELYARGTDWYSSLFDAAGVTHLCGESSTHYTKLPTYPRTIERMQQHLVNLKLIYVMRDPVDRLVSHYIHEWSEGRIALGIDAACAEHPELVDYSRYAMQLEPYLQTFGPQCILPVFFERLVAEPQIELERVCRFIGYREPVRWRPEVDHANISRNRIRKTPVREALIRNRAATVLRRRLIPERWRERIKDRWRTKARPVLGQKQRQEVEHAFDPDLGRLGRQLGLALSCASFKDVARTTSPDWQTSRAGAGR